MDILQFPQKIMIEQMINYILHQSPDTIEQFKHILIMIINGTHLVGAIAALVAHYPELTLLASKLLNLIIAGGSIHEIFTALLSFANSLGLSLNVVLQLLQIISGMLVIF
jgi:hypothetical protein